MPSHVPRLALCALALAACSKSDQPNPNKVPPAARIEAPKAPAAPEAPSAAAEIDPALKDRLARQEAASRMFEKNVLQPQPPKAAVTAPAPEPAKPVPESPKVSAPAKVETAPPPAPKPAVAAKPEPSPPRAEAPASAKSSPPPRTEVAAARPSAAPVQPAAAPAARLVTRVDPEFPREAAQAGVDRGTVTARMTLDEAGAVTRVEVVESNPRRVFDRAVVRALTQWRFNEGAAGRTVETEVDFRR